jgi:hypothetical protein
MVDSKGKAIFSGANSSGSAFVPPVLVSPQELEKLKAGGSGGKKWTGPKQEDDKPPKYYSIPYFSFEADAKEHPSPTVSSCETLCDSDAKCKSFTYMAKKGKCYISSSRMQYDMEFSFYVKHKPEEGGEPTFKSLGGIKYSEESMGKTVGAQGVTNSRCGDLCATDVQCKSYTYRSKDQTCIRSTQSIRYDTDAKYFEKQGVVKDEMKGFKTGKLSIPGAAATANDGPATDPQAEARKIRSQAVLTPEQKHFLKNDKTSHVTEMQKTILYNALSQGNHALKAKNDAKVKAAKETASKAKQAAALKKAAAGVFKSVYDKTLKKSDAELKELMEGDSKSEERAAEKAAKAEAQGKEASAKETERLKHSKSCETSQKKDEAANLEDARLQTVMTDSCNRAGFAVKALEASKVTKEKADADVTKWENQMTTATQKIVYLSAKVDIKRSEEKLAQLQKSLVEQASANKETEANILEIKEAFPDIDTAVSTSQNAMVKSKSELDAAQLAVQGATKALEATTAKAALAGAQARLAKATLANEAATEKQKAQQAKLHKKSVVSLTEQAAVSRLKEEVAKEKINLQALNSQHLTEFSSAKLKLNVAKHSLPPAKDLVTKAVKTVEEKTVDKSKTAEACKSDKYKSRLHDAVQKKYADEMTVCDAERKEKAAAKAKADDEFEAAREAFKLKMEKAREAGFMKMMAAAKLQEESAETAEEKIEAGSKLADAQASKVSAERAVQDTIPKAENAEVNEQKAAAKETAAKAAEKKPKEVVKADATQVKKGEAKEYATDAKNPEVIIQNAKSLLQQLRHAVGIAEVEAGEKDTTAADMATDAGPVHKAHNVTKDAPEVAALKAAAAALKAGNKAGAQADIATAENGINPSQPTQPPTLLPTLPPTESSAEVREQIITQVKREAQMKAAEGAVTAGKGKLKEQESAEKVAAEKEVHTKKGIKELESQLAKVTTEATVARKVEMKKAAGISGQWSFAGSTEDMLGKMGDATLMSTQWETDDTYGKCLGFVSASSEANMGDLKMTSGTISMWVRVDKFTEDSQLFGPTMEGKAAEPVEKDEQVDQQIDKAMSSTVQTSIAKIVTEAEAATPVATPGAAGPATTAPAELDLGEGAQVPGPMSSAPGTVSIAQDGTVVIFDGSKNLKLSAKGTMSVGQWVMLTFTIMKGSVSLFTNGALQHTVKCAADFNGHPFVLGRGFTGAVLNFDIWHKILSSSEISKLSKPASAVSPLHFKVVTPQGKYDLAKSKSSDLTRREIVQKQQMKAAEVQMKAQEKEENAREVKDKVQTKADKVRREEIKSKEKAREEDWEAKKQERATKERQEKLKVEDEQSKEKADEQSQKDKRKEGLQKLEAKTSKQEQDATVERSAKSAQMKAKQEETKTAENQAKSTEKSTKEGNTKELEQKSATSEKERQQKKRELDQENSETQERKQKEDQQKVKEAQEKGVAGQNAAENLVKRNKQAADEQASKERASKLETRQRLLRR